MKNKLYVELHPRVRVLIWCRPVTSLEH